MARPVHCVSRHMLAGQWELTRTEGIDEFLATTGLNWATRKIASAALGRGRATVILKLSTDGNIVTLRLQQGAGKPWHEFDLITDGEQRENTDADGNPEQNAAYWDSQGRLVQDTVGKRGPMIITRYLIDDNTLVAAVCAKSGSALMLRYYHRVETALALPVVEPESHSVVAPVDPVAALPAPQRAAAGPPDAPAAAALADTAAAAENGHVSIPALTADAQRELDAFLTVPFVDATPVSDRAQVGTGVVSETEGMPYTHTCCWEQMVQAYLWRMLNNRFVTNSTVRLLYGLAFARRLRRTVGNSNEARGMRLCARVRARAGRAGHIRPDKLRDSHCPWRVSIQHRFEGAVGNALYCGARV